MSTWRLPRGCVLWFDFATQKGATAYDLSGKDNHGTIYGAQWAKGPIAGALSFDGVDDSVVVADSESIRLTSALSVAYWLYLTEYQEAAGVFKGWRQWGRNYNYRLAVWSDGRARTGVCTPTEEITAPPFPVPLNRWVLLTLTADGNVLKAYLDLELKASVSAPAPYDGFVGEPLRIMGDPNWGEYGKGTIAMVRVYNRALTEREIRAHYWYAKTAIKVPA